MSSNDSSALTEQSEHAHLHVHDEDSHKTVSRLQTIDEVPHGRDYDIAGGSSPLIRERGTRSSTLMSSQTQSTSAVMSHLPTESSHNGPEAKLLFSE